MKNLNTFYTLVALVLTSFSGYGIKNDSLVNNQSTKIERDVVKEISARIVEDEIYFNLTILNESKDGVYSLVKTYPDGSFESVGIKDIGVNTINQPLLYSFSDKCKSTTNVTYELIRISIDVETVETWQYCAKEDIICDCILFSYNN